MKPTFLRCLEEAPGESPAITDDTDTVSYRQLLTQARRAAAVLHSRYGGGNFLLLPAESTIDFVTRLLAIMYSGNTPIPIDPALPENGIDYVRKKSRAAATVGMIANSEWNGAQSVDHHTAAMPAMVLFTSGTSGYPKGVVLTHDNLLHSGRTISQYLGYQDHPSAAVALPLHYSYALLSQVCCMLMSGGHARLFSTLRNPLRFARVVNEQELETFCGVPSTYHALCVFHELSALCMPSVRVLCSAGAAMDRSKYEIIKRIFPNAVFYNNYGMTEAAPRISYIRDDDPRFHEPTCGRPMEGVEVRVVDPETYQPVADGHDGMLVIKGPNVTAGYLNDPELTRAAFTPEGWLISGDIGRMEGEYIFISGRSDDIFNVGGEKLSPLEIERVLNKHEAVELSAVVGVPDQQRGRVPVAFVKLAGQVSRKELISYLEGWLPTAKIPLQYLRVSSFPMTPNGKMQRRRLNPDDTNYVLGEID